MQLSPDKTKWVANVFSDIVLVLIFLIYCGRVHVQSVSTSTVITACHRLCYIVFLFVFVLISLYTPSNMSLLCLINAGG